MVYDIRIADFKRPAMNKKSLKEALKSVTSAEDLMRIMYAICDDLGVHVRRGVNRKGYACFHYPSERYPAGHISLPVASNDGWEHLVNEWALAGVLCHETLHAMDWHKCHPLRDMLPGNLLKSSTHFRAEVAVYAGLLWIGTYARCHDDNGWKIEERKMPGYLGKFLNKMTYANHSAAYDLYENIQKELKVERRAYDDETSTDETSTDETSTDETSTDETSTQVPSGWYMSVTEYAKINGLNRTQAYRILKGKMIRVGKINLVRLQDKNNGATYLLNGVYTSVTDYANTYGISREAAYKRAYAGDAGRGLYFVGKLQLIAMRYA